MPSHPSPYFLLRDIPFTVATTIAAVCALLPLEARADWTPITNGQLQQVSIGSASQIVGVNQGNIWRYTDGAWTQISGQLNNVSVASDGTLWGVNPNPNASLALNTMPVGGSWQVIAAPAGVMPKQVSAGSAANVWLVATNGNIYQRTGSSWTLITGSLSNISVAADGTVIGVNSAGAVWQYTGNNTWRSWPGSPGAPFIQISYGNSSTVYATASDGSLYRWNGSGWSSASGAQGFTWVACGADGTTWATNSVTQIYLWTNPMVTVSAVAPASGGALVWPDGSTCGTGCSKTFTSGSSVTLTAQPAAGYAFLAWGGPCAGQASASCRITASTSLAAVTASFSVVVSATVPVNGSIVWADGSTCGTTCSKTLNVGATVQVQASPSAQFTGWGGPCTGQTTATCTFTVSTAPTPITATFSRPPQILKIAGDNQTKTLFYRPDWGGPAQTYDPLQVKVLDGSGNTVAGATVSWSCVDATGCSMVPSSNPRTATSTTDASGLATLNKYNGSSVLLYGPGGTMRIRATCQGVSTDFMLVANPAPVVTTSLTVISGDNQIVARTVDPAYVGGSATFAPLKLRLVDGSGNGAPGIKICPTVSVPSGMTCDFAGDNHWINDLCGTTDSTGYVSFHSTCVNGIGNWTGTLSGSGSTSVTPLTVHFSVTD